MATAVLDLEYTRLPAGITVAKSPAVIGETVLSVVGAAAKAS